MKIHNPPMIFATEESAREWEDGLAANRDPYGNAVYRYASSWARLMEVAIDAGQTVEECAKQASHDADTEKITGFQYGVAASMLARWWVHGEKLRRWNNLDTQIGTEGEAANESGGVLNPAILSIEARE